MRDMLRATARRFRPVTCVAFAVGAGCGRAAKPEDSPTPRAETAVQVDNRSFLDVDVFLLRGGSERVRLGMVSGLTTHTFLVRPDLLESGTELRFLIAPIGGHRQPVTEAVTVRPGDVITLTIPPDLR